MSMQVHYHQAFSATVFLLTGLGVAVFGETLNRYEVVGIGLGVASIILLVKFGG